MLCDYDCLSVFGGRRTNTRYIFSTTWHKNSVPFSTISFSFKGQKPTQVGFIPKTRFGSDDSQGKRKWVWLSVRLDPRPSTTSPEIASFFPLLGLAFLGLLFIDSQASPLWKQNGCQQVWASLRQPGNSPRRLSLVPIGPLWVMWSSLR